MEPTPGPLETPTAPQARRRRRASLSVGLLMLLIAVIAVGLAVWDSRRRVRVVFVNQSDRIVAAVIVRHEGRTTRLGPVPPRTTMDRRIRSALSEPVRVSFVVPSEDGQPGRRVEAPGLMPSGFGAEVKVQYGR